MTIERNVPTTEYPCIEVERHLSRVEGLMRFLIDTPDAHEEHRDKIMQEVLDETNQARGMFRETLQKHRQERINLIQTR